MMGTMRRATADIGPTQGQGIADAPRHGFGNATSQSFMACRWTLLAFRYNALHSGRAEGKI